MAPGQKSTQLKSQFEKCQKLNGYLSFALELLRRSANQGVTPCICLFSQHFCISKRERGASADAARHCAHELRPHGCQTDKQEPQKCREGPCTTFRSRARLYMDAVSMAKPRRRDVMGKENNSTSYEPCDARSCSSSFRPRGDRFSACRLSENVMHTPCPLLTASRGSSRAGAAPGSD